VPWDQALDLILKMNRLGKKYEGNIIRIATLETIEQQKTLGPLVTEYIAVNYSNVKTDILPHLEKILTKDRGRVTVDERTNIVVMTDVVENIKKAREIVKQLDKVTPQVMIEARVVEASDKFSRELGVNWNVGTNATGSAEIDTNVLGGDGKFGYNAAVNFPFSLLSATDAATMGFSFSKIAGSPFVLNAAIKASETQGDLKIISSPKIVTLDNKKATIKQGIKYPYNVTNSETGIVTTEFKDIDLVLEVTPHVTSDKRISMTINIAKNDLGISYEAGPSFTTKEANTELLVNDGNTVVIGGIIKTTKHMNKAGVPWLSKVPVLGWLFKTEYKKDNKEEMLIFITPNIVQLEQQSNNTDYK
ncbi:MAG: type IV pilus secretin PilQ, partial [Deltaproteobacteria bacterium]|nr:type IV pilus secretin PilQ [Deltaproteobacteria bacterium]